MKLYNITGEEIKFVFNTPSNVRKYHWHPLKNKIIFEWYVPLDFMVTKEMVAELRDIYKIEIKCKSGEKTLIIDDVDLIDVVVSEDYQEKILKCVWA